MTKGSVKVISYTMLMFMAQSCCMPSAMNQGTFPQSITETHTKTTMVMPPSYATFNMPAPSIMQAAPSVQQPMIYQAPACAPSQLGAYDPCAYQVQMPQTAPPKYPIAIPPAPAPQYTIALPHGNPPQYAVVQSQAPVTASVPIKLQANDVCE